MDPDQLIINFQNLASNMFTSNYCMCLIARIKFETIRLWVTLNKCRPKTLEAKNKLLGSNQEQNKPTTISTPKFPIQFNEANYLNA